MGDNLIFHHQFILGQVTVTTQIIEVGWEESIMLGVRDKHGIWDDEINLPVLKNIWDCDKIKKTGESTG